MGKGDKKESVVRSGEKASENVRASLTASVDTVLAGAIVQNSTEQCIF